MIPSNKLIVPNTFELVEDTNNWFFFFICTNVLNNIFELGPENETLSIVSRRNRYCHSWYSRTTNNYV